MNDGKVENYKSKRLTLEAGTGKGDVRKNWKKYFEYIHNVNTYL